MDINYFAVFICAVLSMVIGGVWYGPLFGKKWMMIVGADLKDMEARKKMQQEAMPLYIIQFLLTLMQVSILAYLIARFPDGALTFALLVWLGFVLPTVAGSAMWNNDARKIVWARFLIQAGYQLVLFVVFGFILGM